jgi:hypothetical protein
LVPLLLWSAAAAPQLLSNTYQCLSSLALLLV